MFRVVHKETGRGVYSHRGYCLENKIPISESFNDFRRDVLVKHDYHNGRPALYSDDFVMGNITDLSDAWSYIYGFDNQHKLKQWFSLSEREELESFGFVVEVLSVEEYAVYSKQMITTLSEYMNCEKLSVMLPTEV